MKKIALLFYVLLCGMAISAQTNFQDFALSEAIEKAKQENKMVFVDCYTSWCGPCKYMADKIFTQKEMGEYLNGRFVCVKYDMERGDGPDIAVKYNVAAYPTFLILDTDGTLIYKIVGGTETAEEFERKVEEGFGEGSAYQLKKRYQQGDRDFDFLLIYIESLLKSGLDGDARQVARDILSPLSIEEKSSSRYWFIYDNPRLSPMDSENMSFFLAHVKEFRKNGDRKKVDGKLLVCYENRLEEMLRGRMPAEETEIKKLEKELKANNIQSKELTNYIVMLRAINQKDTGKIYSLYRDIYSDMSETKLSYLYFRPILLFAGKGIWTNEQKEGFIKLTNELQARMETQAMQGSLKHFAEALPKF